MYVKQIQITSTYTNISQDLRHFLSITTQFAGYLHKSFLSFGKIYAATPSVPQLMALIPTVGAI